MAQGVSPEFLGEGDLRYLVKRERELGQVSQGVSEVLDGSHLVDAEATVIVSDPTLERRSASAPEAFERDFERNPGNGVLVAARAQLERRDEFLPNPSGDTLASVLSLLEQRG